jgi:hypothetical protein
LGFTALDKVQKYKPSVVTRGSPVSSITLVARASVNSLTRCLLLVAVIAVVVMMVAVVVMMIAVSPSGRTILSHGYRGSAQQ